MPLFDIFISYSTSDKTTADATCAALESAGIRCWIAPRDVRPGTDWDEAIVQAIDRCSGMVLIFTEGANRSRHVAREVKRAFSKGVPVIPLRVENIRPGETLAYYLDSVHWLDAFTPPLQEHLGRLTHVAKAVVSAQSKLDAGVLGTQSARKEGFQPERSAQPPKHDPVPIALALSRREEMLRRYSAASLILFGTVSTIMWFTEVEYVSHLGFFLRSVIFPFALVADILPFFFALTLAGDLFAVGLGIALATKKFIHPRGYLLLSVILTLGYTLILMLIIDAVVRGQELYVDSATLYFLLQACHLFAFVPASIYLFQVFNREATSRRRPVL
jgi:hypothetical protein